ncbi:hypothetical protein [Agathobaculum sp.]|uniref:hypothetical protein n=1 Tax=Agathobaculum sp. TaxID=2048138 RepID=UPI003AEF746C
MNWREELRKEAEQLHKENEFYSFSATQIQQDKEYFGRFGGQELATKHQETYKRYKYFKRDLLVYLFLFIGGCMMTYLMIEDAHSAYPVLVAESFWEIIKMWVLNITIICEVIFGAILTIVSVSRVRFFRRRLRVIEELMKSNECAEGKTS